MLHIAVETEFGVVSLSPIATEGFGGFSPPTRT